MTTVVAIREFKLMIERRLLTKTSWGRVEFGNEIDKAYQEILEELISKSNDNQTPPKV